MAEITTPQAVKFANEKCRTIADLIQSTRRSCEQFMIEVPAIEAVLAGNADDDVFSDGSAVDGRNPVTKFNMGELKFVVNECQAALNQDDREALVAKWVVNGQPIF